MTPYEAIKKALSALGWVAWACAIVLTAAVLAGIWLICIEALWRLLG